MYVVFKMTSNSNPGCLLYCWGFNRLMEVTKLSLITHGSPWHGALFSVDENGYELECFSTGVVLNHRKRNHSNNISSEKNVLKCHLFKCEGLILGNENN